MLDEIFDEVRKAVSGEFPALAGIEMAFCAKADKENKQCPRVFAHIAHMPDIVCVAYAIEDLPSEAIEGVFWHEFGHLILQGPMGGYMNAVCMDEAHEEALVNSLVFDIFGVHIGYDERGVEYVRQPEG